MPVGYGYRSVEYILLTAIRLELETEGLPESEALERRRHMLEAVD